MKPNDWIAIQLEGGIGWGSSHFYFVSFFGF